MTSTRILNLGILKHDVYFGVVATTPSGVWLFWVLEMLEAQRF